MAMERLLGPQPGLHPARQLEGQSDLRRRIKPKANATTMTIAAQIRRGQPATRFPRRMIPPPTRMMRAAAKSGQKVRYFPGRACSALIIATSVKQICDLLYPTRHGQLRPSIGLSSPTGLVRDTRRDVTDLTLSSLDGSVSVHGRPPAPSSFRRTSRAIHPHRTTRSTTTADQESRRLTPFLPLPINGNAAVGALSR